MNPPRKPNIDFVNQRMSRRLPTKRSRDFPRIVVSSRHLTADDVELLRTSRSSDPQNVVDSQDGFTLHRVGLWTIRDDGAFEARMAHLCELGHSEGFIAAMRMARAKGAWTFRFDDYADVVDELPLGDHEAGIRPGG